MTFSVCFSTHIESMQNIIGTVGTVMCDGVLKLVMCDCCIDFRHTEYVYAFKFIIDS